MQTESKKINRPFINRLTLKILAITADKFNMEINFEK